MSAADELLGWTIGLVVAGLRGLGPVRASNLGGWVASRIGPWLPVSGVARANLAAAFPTLDGLARRRLTREVWDNLGRTIAEMAILDRLGPAAGGPGWEVITHPDLAQTDLSHGAVFFSGHLANWEVLIAASRGVLADFSVLYRAPSIAPVDEAVRLLRSGYGGPGMQQFRKSAAGAKAALLHLRQGGVLALLADQKTNDGIAVPFFGRPAMTAPAVAALALKFRLPLVPAQVQRRGPARFRVILHRPLDKPDTGDRHSDVAELTAMVAGCIEEWVRERPGEWLWLHRRWPKVDGKA